MTASYRILKHNRTRKGLLSKIIASQRASSKKRNHKPPLYTLEELRLWFWSQPNAEELYTNWVDSGYKRELIPSVDRLDDYKGYSLDNIQLITCNENKRKSKPTSGRNIIQYDLNMVSVASYESGLEAAKSVDGCRSAIHRICKGIGKTHKGFIWQYE